MPNGGGALDALRGGRGSGVSSDVPGVVRLHWRGADPPSEASVARRLAEEGVAPHAWSNGPGDRYAAHEHGYEKVLMCAAGSIVFRIGPGAVGAAAVPVELQAGDGFVLPAGTIHSAEVGSNGCTCLEGSR